jgi:hypothetical protein
LVTYWDFELKVETGRALSNAFLSVRDLLARLRYSPIHCPL